LIITIDSRPRIVTEHIVDIEGIEFDLLELKDLVDSLDIGDTIIDPETAESLVKLNAIETYAEEGSRIATQSDRFEELRDALSAAIAESGIDLDE
jgi:hypothetical protein